MSQWPTRRAKQITLEEASALIGQNLAPGDLLAIGGLFKQNRPVALLREVIRSGCKDLKLVSAPGSGYDVDLLIAAGLVSETFLPAVTFESRMCPSFRRAVEEGRLRAHAVDALTVVGGFLAAAHGLPFQPVDAWRGSDVLKYNPLIAQIVCPFTGKNLYATRAINPKLALLHAQEGDRFGNVRHLSTMTYADLLIARAAQTVIVSVDRIVPDAEIIARPKDTSIPCIYVDALVEVPYGAHPTGSFPLYGIDEAHIDQYATLAEAARREEPGAQRAFTEYIDRHVHQPTNQFDYIEAVGGSRRMNELEREARFL